MLKRITILAVTLVMGTGIWAQSASRPELRTLPDWRTKYSAEELETAVLAGGCFWGVEAVFEQLEGVAEVESGYSGGSAETATYRQVGTGRTGHAESVRILYDPDQISFETLLDVFFRVAHDPTQLNYQGPDHGSEYRSVIFYANADQKRAAERSIARLKRQKLYADPIVTELSPLDEFYPAENYHQDFMRFNQDYPYIVYWDWPKVVDLHKEFPELIAR